MNGRSTTANDKQIGIVQWFNINQHEEVKQTIEELKKIGIRSIRTNVSWADWHTPDGKKWYGWLLSTLGKHFEVLPCILYTPPSIALKPKTSAPPANPAAYANFVDEVITSFGEHFQYVELWNEPNNLAQYDHLLDPDWNIFCEMIGAAANWCHQRGKKTVLGGMSPIDPNWLNKMFGKNLMQYIDVVGVHGFPEVYDYDFEGWEAELNKVKTVLKEHNSTAEIWITETGYSTWQKNEKKQLKYFIDALEADVPRMYWRSLSDIQPSMTSAPANQLDHRECHFGLKNADKSPKLLYSLLLHKGLANLSQFRWMTEPVIGKKSKEEYTLITGGSGFVGVNLADRLLSEGKKVMLFDNLSRNGVHNNLFWLQEKHPESLQVMIADVRDKDALKIAVSNASEVFHFAAQVAVTSSLTNPYHDFEVNALGTLNLLEAVRNTPHQPPIIFTSTNKVYGDLHDVKMLMNETRYYPENTYFLNNGISEERNLDFHSPYGCTKGVADQYILDYARTFGLKTVVFRMSCIYGPHQFGTEDQGWVAHFLIQSLKDKHITLYGDGKQVRDILFVEDLVDAFLLASRNINKISGHAFNMGGGPDNTVSLLELIDMIADVSGKRPLVLFDEWRPSDQKYYVSDYAKFHAATGWLPQHSPTEGVKKLYDWLVENADLPRRQNQNATTTKAKPTLIK